MKNIEVDYEVIRNGEVILTGCYATVGLTDKNIKDVAAFILDGHGTGELVDIPSHVYDRIMTAVTETAIRDMKSEIKDVLLESDEVVLQEVLPADLFNLLPDEVRGSIDMTKMLEYYPQDENEEVEEDDADVEPGLFYNEEAGVWDLVGDEEPRKGNTLYLTISQKKFDEIMSGEKTSEEREIKETTVKKFLDVDENGEPYFNSGLIDADDPLNGDIYVWNDGKYPYYPNLSLRYLSLAVGYNKERDTALVELSGFRFKPVPTKTGVVPRFFDDGKNITPDPNGNLCLWCIDMLIKRVVECHREKK